MTGPITSGELAEIFQEAMPEWPRLPDDLFRGFAQLLELKRLGKPMRATKSNTRAATADFLKMLDVQIVAWSELAIYRTAQATTGGNPSTELPEPLSKLIKLRDDVEAASRLFFEPHLDRRHASWHGDAYIIAAHAWDIWCKSSCGQSLPLNAVAAIVQKLLLRARGAHHETAAIIMALRRIPGFIALTGLSSSSSRNSKPKSQEN